MGWRDEKDDENSMMVMMIYNLTTSKVITDLTYNHRGVDQKSLGIEIAT